MEILICATLITLANCQLPFLSGNRRPRPFSVNAGINATNPFTSGQIRFGSTSSIPPTRLIVTQGIHPDVRGKSAEDEERSLQNEWDVFRVQFSKAYASPEESNLRFGIFRENRRVVTNFNRDYAFGKFSFVLNINPLADLLTTEFNKLYNGFGRARARAITADRTPLYPSTFLPPVNVSTPKSVDWIKDGAVTSVKNQLECAGCYAFSATGALEGHYFRKTGQLIDLSPQNLLDCTNNTFYGNLGCVGGFVNLCFQYIQDNPGIDKEDSYPYEAQADQCRFNQDGVGANVTAYIEIPTGDEQALALAVATQGPVSVAIDASHETFKLYSQGIYYEEDCKNGEDDVNHAVLVVGYGEEADGSKYWLVKNSYGTDWGIGGYVKMAKDCNNHCGIATAAYYPLV